MASLGITIRMGASGTHVLSPAGNVDITAMSRQQRGAFAEEISKALNLEKELENERRIRHRKFMRKVDRARRNRHRKFMSNDDWVQRERGRD